MHAIGSAIAGTFRLPLLQLEAGLYRLPGFHHLAWMLSPVAGDAAGALDPVAGLLAQPWANAEATPLHLSLSWRVVSGRFLPASVGPGRRPGDLNAFCLPGY